MASSVSIPTSTPTLNSDNYLAEWSANPKPLKSGITLALSESPIRCKLIPPLIDIIVDYLKNETQVLSIFGEKEWEALFGKVSPAPSIPDKIMSALGNTNPFYFANETNKESTILFYIPEKLDAVSLTPSNMMTIAKKIPKLVDFPIKMDDTHDEILMKLADSHEPAHWVLINKKAIGELFSNCCIPSVVWETSSFRDTIICILAHYAFSNTWLFEGKIVRCKEKTEIWKLTESSKVQFTAAVDVNYQGTPGIKGCHLSNSCGESIAPVLKV